MKIGLLNKFFLIVFFSYIPLTVVAAEELVNQDSVVSDYVSRSNKAYEPYVVIKTDQVLVEIQDVDQNGSADFVLYDENRCGSLHGCREDIYLCTTKDADCKNGSYCFAGSLQEGKITKKGKELKCN